VGLLFNGYPHVMGLTWASFLGDAISDVVIAPGVVRHEYIEGTAAARQLSVTMRKGLTLPRDCSGFKIGEFKLNAR